MPVSITFEPADNTIESHTLTLLPGEELLIGRDDPSKHTSHFLSIPSKVVSRIHAKITLQQSGKLTIQDQKSSAGTFVNSIRLSGPKTLSELIEIKDGDYVQFGENVEYDGVAYTAAVFRVSVIPVSERKQSMTGETGVSEKQVHVDEKLELDNRVKSELDELWMFMRKNQSKENPLIHSLLDRITEIKGVSI